MVFQDKTLTCVDCGQQFVFTASEQEFYVQHGVGVEPTRCKSCKTKKRVVKSSPKIGTITPREARSAAKKVLGRRTSALGT